MATEVDGAFFEAFGKVVVEAAPGGKAVNNSSADNTTNSNITANPPPPTHTQKTPMNDRDKYNEEGGGASIFRFKRLYISLCAHHGFIIMMQ